MKQLPIVALSIAFALPTAAQEATPGLYRAKCQACHMADGNSPLEPMNFADGKWTHGSKLAEVEKVIADGAPGTAMLPFKAKLSREQVAALAEYVRAFDKSLKPEKAKKP